MRLSTARLSAALCLLLALAACSGGGSDDDDTLPDTANDDDAVEDDASGDDTGTTDLPLKCIPPHEPDLEECQDIHCNSGFPCLLNCDYCPVLSTKQPACQETCPPGESACPGSPVADPKAMEGTLLAFSAQKMDIVEPVIQDGIWVPDVFVWPPAVLELESFDASHAAFCGRLWINKGYELPSPISDQSLRNVMEGPSLDIVVDFRSNPLAVVSASPSMSANGFDYQFFGMRAESVHLSFVVSQTSGELASPELGAYDWNLDYITDPDTGSDRLRFENMPSRVTSREELGVE